MENGKFANSSTANGKIMKFGYGKYEIREMINKRTMRGLEADWTAREWRNVQ